MAVVVKRKRSVLSFQGSDETVVRFGRHDEDTEIAEAPQLHLPKHEWLDLGEPTQVTIIMWPGDRQDLMGSDAIPE